MTCLLLSSGTERDHSISFHDVLVVLGGVGHPVDLHGLVLVLPLPPALVAALAGGALGAGEVAAGAGGQQAVANVEAAAEQLALAVVDADLLVVCKGEQIQ